jgi:type IV pilus assembly protein PilE
MRQKRSNQSMPGRGNGPSGFTLIELLITVVLLGVLAAIAIPSYSAYITRGQRAAAKAALMQSAQGLERYYTVNGSYTAAASAVIPFAPNDGGQITYALTPTLASQTYSLTATPCGTAGTCPSASTFNDAECGALTLTNTGQKTVSGGTNTDPAYCWGR